MTQLLIKRRLSNTRVSFRSLIRIHSNSGDGIFAIGSAKVIIHLPSHHNTSYNNTGEDQFTNHGGTITNVEE